MFMLTAGEFFRSVLKFSTIKSTLDFLLLLASGEDSACMYDSCDSAVLFPPLRPAKIFTRVLGGGVKIEESSG